MHTWSHLIQNFPRGVGYIKPIYLYQEPSTDTHYFYVPYKLGDGNAINIVLEVSFEPTFRGLYSCFRSLNFFNSVSDLKRDCSLTGYRYVKSYRK